MPRLEDPVLCFINWNESFRAKRFSNLKTHQDKALPVYRHLHNLIDGERVDDLKSDILRLKTNAKLLAWFADVMLCHAVKTSRSMFYEDLIPLASTEGLRKAMDNKEVMEILRSLTEKQLADKADISTEGLCLMDMTGRFPGLYGREDAQRENYCINVTLPLGTRIQMAQQKLRNWEIARVNGIKDVADIFPLKVYRIR